MGRFGEDFSGQENGLLHFSILAEFFVYTGLYYETENTLSVRVMLIQYLIPFCSYLRYSASFNVTLYK